MPTYQIIRILGDDAWDNPIVQHGPALNIPGSGTEEDPYIIEGIHVRNVLKIQNTEACFVIRNNYFSDHQVRGETPFETRREMAQIQLNYNGECVHVYRNHLADAVANAATERTEYSTGGLWEDNEIEHLNMFRHFSGEFRNNTIGTPTGNNYVNPHATGMLEHRLANFDGFYQARIHNNTFYGSVDLDFHGHYHGTGFYAPRGHYHGDDTPRSSEHDNERQRWNSVSFSHNLIDDPDGYGLRYEDRNHRVDDRISLSEDRNWLNGIHRHHTWLRIEGNEVRNGRIMVDVFNPDRIEQLEPDGSRTPFNPLTLDYEWRNYHPWRNDGWIDIIDNVVTTNERDPHSTSNGLEPVELRRSIYILSAQETDIRIAGNQVSWHPLGGLCTGLSTDPISCDNQVFGLDVRQIKDSWISIRDNAVGSGYDCGVFARLLDAAVSWEVVDNVFSPGIQTEVCQQAVTNPPARS